MQPDLAGVTGEVVGGIQEDARRLGLTWQMVKATVVAGTTPSQVTAVIDGDTVTVGMISMIGVLQPGARVWVMVIPPGGNYITGMVADFPWPSYRARQVLTATKASITFTGIPTNLRRLRVSYFVKADNAVTVQLLFMRINSDAAAGYFYEYVQGQNSGAGSAVALSGTGQTQAVVGLCGGTSTFFFASGTIEMPAWDNAGGVADLPWTFLSQGLGSGVATFTTNTGGGIYNGAPPYTSLLFFPQAGSFIAGTDIQLEGWPT
jgi:hypothetical protein